jgi:hypothetical protein
MPRKPKASGQYQPICVALPIRNTDRALCKTHGVYLERRKVMFDGKPVYCWWCPTGEIICRENG